MTNVMLDGADADIEFLSDFLVAQAASDRDAEGVPEWEVKDVLIFKKPNKNQQFFFSYSPPRTENGMENLDLIVLALEPRRKTYKILQAWGANVERERFETVSTQAVVCRYD